MKFADLATRIRTERNLAREVPGFDTENGNERAKYLFLLEAPGPKAVQSGRISFDNPDPSARNFREQLAAAAIDRKEIALWNVVPWYIGNEAGTSIRAASVSDVRDGIGYLVPLIEAMPNLRCIVLVGGAARQAHMFLSRKTTARIVTCHHPSARVLISNPEAAKENIEVFRFVKATT
ncbi:MAG: uracil-DNA glycosylase [Sulfuritalea sp.]|nr:uracil-DNA glycosylase [Sulfuritalea sp.]